PRARGGWPRAVGRDDSHPESSRRSFARVGGRGGPPRRFRSRAASAQPRRQYMEVRRVLRSSVASQLIIIRHEIAMRVHRILSSLAVLSLFASACADDDGSAADDHASGDETGHTHPDVTYWEHVAPLLTEHCGSCHRAGGAAPFDLTTYESAKTWAPASVAAMQSRTMPPWLMTADGSCGEFRDARWLDQSVI